MTMRFPLQRFLAAASLVLAAACSSAAVDAPTSQSSAAASSSQVLTPTSGGSITDSDGNVWTLTPDGSVQENGQDVPGGGGTSSLAYVNGTIYGQDANSGSWYTYSNGQWNGPTDAPAVPSSSGSGGNGGSVVGGPSGPTVLTTSSGGSFKDGAGNTWTLTNDGRVQENGQDVPGGGGTSSLTYVNGTVYGQDAASGGWYAYQNGQWNGPQASPVTGSTGGTPSGGNTGGNTGNTGNTGGTTTSDGTRVSAPLAGNVSQGSWVTNQRINVAAMPNGFMAYNYLLPQGYDASGNTIYPILFYGHENDEGMGGGYPADGNNLVYYEADGAFNTVAFRTNFPCIVVVPEADQSIDGSGADGNSNFGGYNDSPNSGGNEQGINALLQYFIANFKVDVTRAYLTGSSLGAIGSLAWLVDNNRYNGINKFWTAAMGLSEQLYRPGTPNSQVFERMRNVTYIAVSTPYDNSPESYDQPAWSYYTGNGNYPQESDFANGGLDAIRAGSSQYYYIEMTSGTMPWDTYRRLDADGGRGTALYTLLFSTIAP